MVEATSYCIMLSWNTPFFLTFLPEIIKGVSISCIVLPPCPFYIILCCEVCTIAHISSVIHLSQIFNVSPQQKELPHSSPRSFNLTIFLPLPHTSYKPHIFAGTSPMCGKNCTRIRSSQLPCLNHFSLSQKSYCCSFLRKKDTAGHHNLTIIDINL